MGRLWYDLAAARARTIRVFRSQACYLLWRCLAYRRLRWLSSPGTRGEGSLVCWVIGGWLTPWRNPPKNVIQGFHDRYCLPSVSQRLRMALI